MKQSRVSFIYFDLGNVIVNFSHQQMVDQIAAVARVDSQRVHDLIFDKQLQYRYETGQINTSGFHQHFVAETGSDVTTDALAEAASSIFTLNSEIVPILGNLRSCGVRIGILSNTCEAHWKWVRNHFPILSQLFELNVLSFEVHSMKPEPEIYEAAAERAGVPPETIFFTDDREENVSGAAKQGFDATVFESARQLANELHDRGVQFNY